MVGGGAHSALASLAARHGLGGARARAFGTLPGDLEIDFGAPRAVVVTELLAACFTGEGLELDPWWALPISTRTLLLVALGELTAPAIEVYLPCPCGETAELELPSHELAEFAAERAAVAPTVEIDGASLRLRLPTGRDQLRWAALAAQADPSLARRVLVELVVDGPSELPEELVPQIDRALSEADPLVELRLDTACPSCGAALTGEVDLEAIAIARLRRVQLRLLEDIHHLARTYHWSEQQIARIPAWRRAEYLALLGRSRA
ncbi:MAG: hypothetical protein ACTHU0_11275 [Kofleriaceae bacterium]